MSDFTEFVERQIKSSAALREEVISTVHSGEAPMSTVEVDLAGADVVVTRYDKEPKIVSAKVTCRWNAPLAADPEGEITESGTVVAFVEFRHIGKALEYKDGRFELKYDTLFAADEDDGEAETMMSPEENFAAEYVARPEHLLDAVARKLVRYTLFRLPDEAREWLRHRAAPVVFCARFDGPSITKNLPAGLPAGSRLMLLHPRTLALTRQLGSAIVAHELGHVFNSDAGTEPKGFDAEFAADACAARWGFGTELIEAHEAELAAGVSEEVAEAYRTRIARLRKEASST